MAEPVDVGRLRTRDLFIADMWLRLTGLVMMLAPQTGLEIIERAQALAFLTLRAERKQAA